VHCESVIEGWVQKFVEVSGSMFGSLIHLNMLGKFWAMSSKLCVLSC
jgi:hypothetical protein